MSYVPLKIAPGANSVDTPLLLEASGWSQTTNIRFFQQKIQQQGFFQRLSSLVPRGVCRGLFPWADTSGQQYIAEGTNSELAVYNNGEIYDITPADNTSNLSTAFTTTMSSPTVTIADSGDYAIAGNYINIDTYVSIDNLLLQGPYLIQTVGSGTFTITSPVVATTGVSGAGVTSKFNTTMGSADVQVTLANHGFVTGNVYTVHVSTAVGGLTLYGQYVVGTVTSSSVFHINGGGNAGSTANAYENSDEAQVQYLIPTGLVSQGGTAGYGNMPYGLGPYGLGELVSYLPLQQWFFGAWGSYLIAQPTNGAIYVWMPASGFFNNPATVISQAPAYNTAIFIAEAEQQIVAVGAQDSVSGDQDPLLIRWCDVADYTDWTATTTNQAGSFRIPLGSRIIGGISVSLQNLIWTDLGLWAMQYIGTPYVYSITQIATGCGLIAARAQATLSNAVIWMSQKGFFIYSGGSVTPIPCPIWDTIFNNLNYQQVDKITTAPNSAFTELCWHIPSASGSGEDDTVIKLNLLDGSWDYSNGANAQPFVRTAAYDQSIIGPPMGVDLNGILQQSETGTQADTVPLVSSARTGWFKLADGLLVMSVERIIPDFVINGTPTLTISVYTANYPGDTPQLQSAHTITASTEYFIARARGRLVAIQIDCSSTNSAFWRLGEPLVLTYPAGRRP